MLGDREITFIGSGIMGEAMIGGLLAKDVLTAHQIIASDPLESRRFYIEKTYGVRTTSSNTEAIQGAAIIVLSVKPQVLGALMPTLKGKIDPNALVMSIVAGATIQSISQGFRHAPIVRVMPNTPAQVGMSMTVWTASPEVTDTQRSDTRRILQALGEEMAVPNEQDVDLATAVSGAGPGFVFLFIEAMIDAGVQMGLSRTQAQTLTLQTISGSVELMRQTNEHPTVLRNRVTSPGGVTAAGLYELEKGGLRTTLCDAVYASFKRTQDLSHLNESFFPQRHDRGDGF
jgi:pyrroline-5-carboxylate reductase